MVNLKHVVSTLQAKRKELLDELNAVDKAIAALNRTEVGGVETDEERSQEMTAQAPGAVTATKLRPKRVLSDEHKRAISEGRHKARGARDVAAGLAREMPEEGFVPAISTRASGRPPRLVKRVP